MAIPSKQIGWSTQSNLLWEISKELERLTCVMAGGCTTTTTTTVPPYYAFILAYSNGNGNVGACANLPGIDIFYTTSNVIGEGVFIYTDIALTIPAAGGWYAYDGNSYKTVETSGQLQAPLPCV
jgi:hypothetical protein